MMDADATRRARADQPDQPLGEHEGRRPLRQAHRLRRQARRAAHDPAAAGRRHPHERNRLRRHHQVTDTNGDGVADKREVVFTGIGQSGDANIEHQKAGLSGTWTTGSTPPTTRSASAGRRPGSCASRPAPNGGQWGLASDDDGKPWFVDAGGERGPMNFQYPIHYGAFTPCPAVGGRHHRRPRRRRRAPPSESELPGGDGERVREGFRGRVAGARHRRHAGRHRAASRMPAENLNHFTAATGPAIVRGDRCPRT